MNRRSHSCDPQALPPIVSQFYRLYAIFGSSLPEPACSYRFMTLPDLSAQAGCLSSSSWLQGEPIQLVLPYPVLSAPPEKQMGDTPPESNATVELAEETISIGKRCVETGRVRVRI